MNPSPLLNEKCFNHKRTRSTGYRNLSLKLVELAWCGDNTFCFLNECLNSAYVFWSCCLWMLNMLALERMMKKETCYLIIWKIIKMILEARKSSEYKSLQKKKYIAKKKKEKEKASRKSQKLFKPKGKSKKPIAL